MAPGMSTAKKKHCGIHISTVPTLQNPHLSHAAAERPPSPRRATGLWVYITNGHHPPVRVTYVMRWGVLHAVLCRGSTRTLRKDR